MAKVDVGLVEEYREDGLHLRKTELRLKSGSHFEVHPAVNPSKVKRRTLDLLGNEAIFENSVNITLDKLRKIDNDADAQREFIKRELRIGRYDNFSLNIINLLVKTTDKIENQDIEYLRALIDLYSLYTIPVPPVVYYYETKTFTRIVGATSRQLTRVYKTTPLPFGDYLNFMKRFLKSTTSSNIGNVLAMTVPCNLPHAKVSEFASVYKDFNTPIVISDGHGQEQLTVLPQINSLLYSKDISSVTQRQGEAFILYGYDSAKSKMNRSAGEIATAKNVLQHFYRFSSFGPRYTFPKMRINNKPGAPNPQPRIYYREELGYAKRNYKDALARIQNWISENSFSADAATSTYSNYVKDYEAVKLTETSREIYSHVEKKELEKIIQRGTLKDEISSVKNALRNPPD
ncbi:MAG: hypothetical protein KIS30_04150 [Thermoplasmata archaeon]|nr:hypothetical protein [Candidatus Sysuiplasma acidicola]MBX8645937.1 hypothetical protein [Candidatus Sysuiplasma acidicola]